MLVGRLNVIDRSAVWPETATNIELVFQVSVAAVVSQRNSVSEFVPYPVSGFSHVGIESWRMPNKRTRPLGIRIINETFCSRGLQVTDAVLRAALVDYVP